MKPLIAGNWKMNGFRAALQEIERLAEYMGGRALPDRDVLVCLPATLLAEAAKYKTSGVLIGAQDCHATPSGAHTGDISAEMLQDAGADFVIVGHSERRNGHGESSAEVRDKASAALRAGLVPIICVGEQLDERKAGREAEIVSDQIAESIPNGEGEIVVAYEPVWAIGTGLTPSIAEISTMHALLREKLGRPARILYGGSVKASNAKEILAVKNVDGALVGGASLKAEEFFAIIKAAPRP
jgi:triosephosphate isomerase